ncbi:MAG: pyridoxamine 5'-phosphate oxidase family protein, partial [Candidatus Bathycorpusculaceae bacterium]
PFQYVFMGGSLYFHFTDYGRKMKLLMRGEPVCVEIEEYKPDMSEYRFVVLTGNLETVIDPRERADAITKMAEEGKKRLSKNFLAAHGFKKGEDWSSFTSDKPMLIVKLEKVFEEIGLKSP